MAHRKLVSVCLALLLVAASGCLGVQQADGPDEDAAITNGMNATEITSAIAAANASVESYDLRVNTTTTGTEFGGTSLMEGVIDRADRRVRLRTTYTYDNRTGENRLVLDGTTIYSKREGADRWQRTDGAGSDLLEVSWSQYDRLSVVVRLLEASDASVVGSDTLNGTPVTLLEAEPSLAAYRRAVGAGNVSATETERNASLSLRVAVANETGNVRRSKLSLRAAGQNSTVGTTSVTQFRGYGTGAEIRTPQETVSERGAVTTEVASAGGADADDERATVGTQGDESAATATADFDSE